MSTVKSFYYWKINVMARTFVKSCLTFKINLCLTTFEKGILYSSLHRQSN